MWWTAKDLVGLPGQPGTVQNVTAKARREGVYDRDREGQGGGKEYHFDYLPAKTRLYLIDQAAEVKKATNPGQAIAEVNSIEADQHAYAHAPAWAKDHADRTLFILHACENLKGNDLKAFVDAWNEKHPDESLSDKTIYRWRTKLDASGKSGLLPAWGNRKGDTLVKDDWFEFFASQYLSESRPSVNISWHSTFGYALHETPGVTMDTFPTAVTFFRKLQKKYSESVVYMARYGYQAWNRKYASYIVRDYSNQKAGETWVGDHHQIDVGATTKDGATVFPWVTAWRDMKSGKMLSWFVHAESPNSDHIFQSFYHAAVKFGLPESILIDNGKDYRCKDFAGGRKAEKKIKVEVDERKATSMLLRLGIEPHFAIPYNAQAKPIERDFLKVKEWFSKTIPGYRGGDVVERPEKLAKEIKQGALMDFDDQYLAAFDSFIEDVFNKMPSNGKVHQGRSADRVWNEEFTVSRQVRSEALKLFCMRSTGVMTIGRNGIKDSRLESAYWDDWMVGHKGDKVYMRRDPKAWHEAWVFNAENDAYMGMGKLVGTVPVFVKNETDRKSLEEEMARKNREKKVHRAILKNLRPQVAGEALFYQKTALQAMNESTNQPPAALAPVIQIQSTKMDEVVLQKERMDQAGKSDVASFTPKVIQFPKKQKIYTSLVEKEADERRAREAVKGS